MNKEEIIEMVMQIGGCDRPEDDSPALKMFVTFATLVAEKERDACTAHAITSAEKAIDVAIKLERQACATIVDEVIDFWVKAGYPECAEVRESMNISEAIRARGQE